MARHEVVDGVDATPHQQAQREGWQQVAHLAQVADVDEPPRVVGVDDEGYHGGDDVAEAKLEQPHRQRDAEDAHADALLDDFQPEEQVGVSLDLQQVEVDGVDGVPHHREADDLQEDNARFPLGRDHRDDQRARQRGEHQHDGEDDEGRGFEHPAVVVGQLLVVALQLAEHGEGDVLEHARGVLRGHGGVVLRPVVDAQLGGGVVFADKDGGDVAVERVEHGRGHHLVAVAPEVAERLSRPARGRQPAHGQPVEHDVEQSGQQARHDQRPQPEPGEGHADADAGGEHLDGDGNLGRGLEVEPPLEDDGLWCAQRAPEEAEGGDANHRHEHGRAVEVGYPRRGGEEDGVHGDTDHQTVVERRGEVALRQVGLAHHRVAKSRLLEYHGHGHEHGRQGGDAVVLRGEQPRHHDADTKLHSVVGKLVEEAPVESSLGLAFQVFLHVAVSALVRWCCAWHHSLHSFPTYGFVRRNHTFCRPIPMVLPCDRCGLAGSNCVCYKLLLFSEIRNALRSVCPLNAFYILLLWGMDGNKPAPIFRIACAVALGRVIPWPPCPRRGSRRSL